MSSASLTLLRTNLVEERDELREAIASSSATNDAGNGGSFPIQQALERAAILTAAIAEIDAVNT